MKIKAEHKDLVTFTVRRLLDTVPVETDPDVSAVDTAIKNLLGKHAMPNDLKERLSFMAAEAVVQGTIAVMRALAVLDVLAAAHVDVDEVMEIVVKSGLEAEQTIRARHQTGDRDDEPVPPFGSGDGARPN